MSPTQRTLKELKTLGFQSHIVERWNAYARVRVDVFGFGDILACYPGVGVLLIQATSGTNHSKRKDKIVAEPMARTWLDSGGRIEVWSFAKKRTTSLRKNGTRGTSKVWMLRREEITVQDLPMEVPQEGVEDGPSFSAK